MDEEIVKQIVDELLSSLEPLESSNAALLQFLKAKGMATDEELAPFLEQAANTANVRWRAVRVRTHALISNALKSAEESGTGAAENSAKTVRPSPQSDAKKEDKTDKETVRKQNTEKSEAHNEDGQKLAKQKDQKHDTAQTKENDKESAAQASQQSETSSRQGSPPKPVAAPDSKDKNQNKAQSEDKKQIFATAPASSTNNAAKDDEGQPKKTAA